jgi:hypothetical protein
MEYTDLELENYENYLNFVRRKMIDDLDLEVSDIMDININNIMPYTQPGPDYPKDKSQWHFTCFNEHDKRKDRIKEKGTSTVILSRMCWGFSYDAISYDVWMRMVLQEERNRKISQLGL